MQKEKELCDAVINKGAKSVSITAFIHADKFFQCILPRKSPFHERGKEVVEFSLDVGCKHSWVIRTKNHLDWQIPRHWSCP